LLLFVSVACKLNDDDYDDDYQYVGRSKKVWTLATMLLITSQTQNQQRFTISELPAHWHALMVEPHIVRTMGN